MKKAALLRLGLSLAASLGLHADREPVPVAFSAMTEQVSPVVAAETVTNLGWLVAQRVCELDGYILDIPLNILYGHKATSEVDTYSLQLMISDSQPRSIISFEFTDAQLGADQTTIIAGAAEYPKEVEALNVPAELAVGKNSIELIC